MNVCFLLDNSISMSQQGYNGLTFLQMAKGYIQKVLQNKGSTPFYNGQLLTYHLFVSSSPAPLSTYEHEELHFATQLKYVQVSDFTDLAMTLMESFKQLNKFRVGGQCETVVGTIDPFLLRPSIVLVFTDSSDPVTLNTIQEMIQSEELKCKHDCEVFLLRICPPSLQQKVPIDLLIKAVEADESTESMKKIANQLNGKYFQIHRYQYGFDVTQSIISTLTPRIHIKFNILTNTLSQINYKDSGINFLEVQQKESESVVNKYTQSFMVSSVHKGRPRKSLFPLPVLQPKIRLEYFGVDRFYNPEYVIDISKTLDCKIHQFLPYQKLELQPGEFTSVLQDKMKQLNIQQLSFPIYFHPDDRMIPFGLLKATPKEPLQLKIFMANFIEFNPIFELIRDRKTTDKINMNTFEASVQSYLLKVPALYDTYIIELLFMRGFNPNIKPRISQDLARLNQIIIDKQRRQKVRYQNMLLENAKSHQKYNSICCAVYSPHFKQWSLERQTIFPEDQKTRQLKNMIKSMLEMKLQLLPDVDDEIRLQKSVQKSMTSELDNYQIKTGGENQPLGNPYKKKKKVEVMDVETRAIKDLRGEDNQKDMEEENIEQNMKMAQPQENQERVKQSESNQIAELLTMHQKFKIQFQQIQKQDEQIWIANMPRITQNQFGQNHPKTNKIEKLVEMEVQKQDKLDEIISQQSEHAITTQQSSLQPLTSLLQQTQQKHQQKPEQTMINSFCIRENKKIKTVSLEFNPIHLCMPQYHANWQILNNNGDLQ